VPRTADFLVIIATADTIVVVILPSVRYDVVVFQQQQQV